MFVPGKWLGCDFCTRMTSDFGYNSLGYWRPVQGVFLPLAQCILRWATAQPPPRPGISGDMMGGWMDGCMDG